MAYKPFGEKLDLDKDGNKPTKRASVTNRGYTGHEHIEETKLIHMNARLYDPSIARFLSADSIIPDMYDTQAFNRYSYVKNNPLKYTDPSGHSWLSKAFKKITKYMNIVITVLVVAVVTYLTWGVGTAAFAAAGSGMTGSIAAGAAMGSIAGFTGGVVGTMVNGGSWSDALKAGLRGALVGAISGAIAGGIGSHFGHDASFFNAKSSGAMLNAGYKALSHGVSRAAIAAAQGQKALAGFFSGFVASGFSVGKEGYGGIPGRTAIMAAISGTVSQATGGKFANGAVVGRLCICLMRKE